MCGIVGYIGPRDATPVILNGLKRLEYRGYDSAGLAILENGQIAVRRDHHSWQTVSYSQTIHRQGRSTLLQFHSTRLS